VGDSTIRGAAQAAARAIEQQAQALSPARVKEAAQEAAKVIDTAAQPIRDSVKAIPKQAKAIAKLCLDNPALAPLVMPAVPFMMAAKGAVAIHESHVAVAKAVVSGAKETIHAAHSLSAKQKFMIAANPAFMLMPPGVREMAIAGAIKHAAEAGAQVGGAAKAAKGLAAAAAAAAVKKSPNND
jgi:hypothetical protein